MVKAVSLMTEMQEHTDEDGGDRDLVEDSTNLRWSRGGGDQQNLHNAV